jgi:hypothetical protein
LHLSSKSYCLSSFSVFVNNHPLQDSTVLPTENFRRCVIRSSSVIFLPTSSPTDYVRRHYFRRWFQFPSPYRSEKQKNHLPMILQTEVARQKKKDSRLKYTDGYLVRRWYSRLKYTNGFLVRRWYCDLPTEINRR